MNEKTFQHNMSAAKAFYDLGTSSSFLSGYMLGLRKLYHGESFGTQAEHEKYMSMVDDPDPDRESTGRGYKAGLSGLTIYEVLKAESLTS